jgi:hypothetical protein
VSVLLIERIMEIELATPTSYYDGPKLLLLS